MKRFLISILCSLWFAGIPLAQNQPVTLFGNMGGVKISGFGGPSIGVGVVDGTATMFNGGGGAIMFNNFFFGGYGTSNSIPNVTRQIGGKEARLRMQHGGIWTGYDIQAHRMVHFTTNVQIGWGNIRLYRSYSSFFDDAQSIVHERFATISPELGIEVNITRFLKIALTGGYRVAFYKEIQQDNGSNINLDGQYGSLTFKFGWFGKTGPLKAIKGALKK